MKTLKLENGQKITNTFQYNIFQTRDEALQFGINEMEWNEDDVLDRNLQISVKTEEAGIIDLNLDCIMVDAGSDDYLYFIS